MKFSAIFAASEGRNPRVKNAFLALSCTKKSPNSSRGMETKLRSFCYVYVRVQPCAVLCKVYTNSVGYLFSVHFYCGVWRYHSYDERDKSLRFSCTI